MTPAHDLARSFLIELHGHTVGIGQLACLWTKRDKKSRFFNALVGAAEYAISRAQETDVYVCMSTFTTSLPPNKRGEKSDCAAISGLWADLDIAGPTHKATGLPPTPAEAMRILDGLPLPTLIVHSGHGLQPYWLFSEPWIFENDKEREEAAAFVKTWGDMLKGRAAAFGWTADSVFDLPRVLRLPGTMNHKGQPVPVTIYQNSGGRYDRRELAAFLEKSASQFSKNAGAPLCFFPATVGTVTIDGTDGTANTVTSLEQEVAYVLEKSVPKAEHTNDPATLFFGRALTETIPPHDERTERCALGSMVMDLRAARVAAEMVTCEDFYVPRHRVVFDVLCQMLQAGENLDEVTGLNALRKAGKGFSGDDDFFGRLITETPTAANVEEYCATLLELSKRRKTESAAIKALTRLTNRECIEEITAELRANLDSLQVSGNRSAPLTLAEWIQSDAFLKPVARVSTGYATLDQALAGGLMPGSLYVLAGATSKGKSALAVNLARRMAERGTKTLLVTLEDAAVQAVRKVVAAAAEIPLASVERQSADAARPIQAAIARLRAAPLLIVETANEEALLSAVRAHVAGGVRMVVIDQMSHIKTEAKDQFERAAIVSRVMQDLAKTSGAVVLLLSQVNRAGCQREGGPELYDLRDSGTIEQDARGVLLIKTLDIVDGRDIGVMTVEIAKHSFGPRDINEKFTYLLSQQRIEPYVPETGCA